MSMDKQLEKELSQLKNWTQGKNEQWLYENQEIVLTNIYILTNKNFRKIISLLRKRLGIPPHWYTKQNKDLYDEWVEWHEGNNGPQDSHNNTIISICKKLRIDPIVYGEFVLNYLYFGDIAPARPLDYPHARNEFKYKARIEIDLEESALPQKGYVRFYRDTTRNKLKRFIEDNWGEISRVQSYLQPYPHKKKYGRFRRDIQVYILKLLGNTATEIANTIHKENVLEDGNSIDELEAIYTLEQTTVFKIIEDIEQRIRDINRKIQIRVKPT